MSRYSWDDDDDEGASVTTARSKPSTADRFWGARSSSGAIISKRREHRGRVGSTTTAIASKVAPKADKESEFYEAIAEERDYAYKPEPELEPEAAKEAEDRGPSLFDIMGELLLRAVERALAAVAYEVFQFFGKRRFLTPRERRMRYAVA